MLALPLPKPPSFTLPHDHDLLIILSPAVRSSGQPFYLNFVSPSSLLFGHSPGIGDPPAPLPVTSFGKSGQDEGAVGGSRRWGAWLAIDVWAFDGCEMEYSLTSKDREEHRAPIRDRDG
ncbi:hypothetical protein GALMADRAFT_148127 [Galerina marginata CBS 339.88]|uniref:Uncharacterized protein n=1 Tax=Galerina marginata (strain CBS 339.88) TaxID=685588 RepID=A0A067S5G6_GALM3|nr:hypothetical protein GALMADRAFT_148127 [Galerina marginata CBS 339.88]